jgi:hypothetical protein
MLDIAVRITCDTLDRKYDLPQTARYDGRRQRPMVVEPAGWTAVRARTKRFVHAARAAVMYSLPRSFAAVARVIRPVAQ